MRIKLITKPDGSITRETWEEDRCTKIECDINITPEELADREARMSELRKLMGPDEEQSESIKQFFKLWHSYGNKNFPNLNVLCEKMGGLSTLGWLIALQPGVFVFCVNFPEGVIQNLMSGHCHYSAASNSLVVKSNGRPNYGLTIIKNNEGRAFARLSLGTKGTHRELKMTNEMWQKIIEFMNENAAQN